MFNFLAKKLKGGEAKSAALIPADFAMPESRRSNLSLRAKVYSAMRSTRLAFWGTIMLVTVAVIAVPFVPALQYAFNDSQEVYFTVGQLQKYETDENGALTTQPQPQPAIPDNRTANTNSNSGTRVYSASAAAAEQRVEGNRLIIPKAGIDTPIIASQDAEYAWDRGAWLYPSASTPDKGSNTVLSAHRFRYRPPYNHTFYNLDKLDIGDRFSVFYNGKEYIYEVYVDKITSPYAVEILRPTSESVVTLYTCNPLFSTKERLVVQGKLIDVR